MKHMKTVIVALLSILTLGAQEPAPVTGTTNTYHVAPTMSLVWDHEDPAFMETTFEFLVFKGDSETTIVPPINVGTNKEVNVTKVLKDFPNGKYKLYVVAVGRTGLKSAPSEDLYAIWHFHAPKKITNPRFKFTEPNILEIMPPVPVSE